jgi:hypothetical protein
MKTLKRSLELQTLSEEASKQMASLNFPRHTSASCSFPRASGLMVNVNIAIFVTL